MTTDLCAMLKVAIEEHQACFLKLYPKWWSVSVKYRDLSCDTGGSLQNESNILRETLLDQIPNSSLDYLCIALLR